MSTLTKVLTVLVALFSVVLSAVYVTSAAQWQNWRAMAQNLQEQRDAALAERQEVEAVLTLSLTQKDGQLQQALNARDEALRKVAEAEAKQAELRAQLGTMQKDVASADASRKKLEELASISTGQAAALDKQSQTLLTENIDLQTRNQQLLQRTYELTAELTIKEDELRNLRERQVGRETPLAGDFGLSPGGSRLADALPGETPDGVATLSAVQATPNIRGEVIDVAGNYASINIGESSGLARGMIAMVFRGNQYLADLELDTVRPREAGGKLATLVGAVRAGDRVQFIRR
ncbi:MAG: hypothetical protein SF069_09365 [Phycisphaerae bacterium]|nr:hypothetical protein [Phycisphaerae bacterium]